MTDEHKTHTPRGGWYGILVSFGVMLIAFTLLFSFIHWNDQIMAAVTSVPEIYPMVILFLFGLSAVAAIAYGYFASNEDVYMLGVMALTILGFSTALSFLMPASKLLADILRAITPDSIPAVIWLVASLSLAVLMLLVGGYGMYRRGGSDAQ